MPKATVTVEVTYEIEATDELFDRMLNDFDDFYPSANRDQVWEKLALWLGVRDFSVSHCDGLADLPNDAASAREIYTEFPYIEETQ